MRIKLSCHTHTLCLSLCLSVCVSLSLCLSVSLSLSLSLYSLYSRLCIYIYLSLNPLLTSYSYLAFNTTIPLDIYISVPPSLPPFPSLTVCVCFFLSVCECLSLSVLFVCMSLYFSVSHIGLILK